MGGSAEDGCGRFGGEGGTGFKRSAGMGLIFRGAVVLAAAMGAVLIVKRMKRGL